MLVKILELRKLVISSDQTDLLPRGTHLKSLDRVSRSEPTLGLQAKKAKSFGRTEPYGSQLCPVSSSVVRAFPCF